MQHSGSDKSNTSRAVFCDIDGTLISDEHRILPETLCAIKELGARGIPFAIASARSPQGIFPLMDRYHLKTYAIAFSGALILDEDRHIIREKSMSLTETAAVLSSVKTSGIDTACSVYTEKDWIVEDPSDARNRLEAEIVGVDASPLRFEDLPEEQQIYNILLLTQNSESSDALWRRLSCEFPSLHVTKSWSNYVEVTNGEVNKADSVKQLCSLLGVPFENATAFGDNYNDVEMLEAVGHGVLMGNGPADLKKRIRHITEDNNHDGIAKELRRMGLVNALAL